MKGKITGVSSVHTSKEQWDKIYFMIQDMRPGDTINLGGTELIVVGMKDGQIEVDSPQGRGTVDPMSVTNFTRRI